MGNSAFGAGVNWATKQAAKSPNLKGLVYGAIGGIFVGAATAITALKIKKKRK